MAPSDPDAEWWTTTEVAQHLGVTVGTVSTYRARGQMPAPDQTVGRTHMWRPQRIIDWHAARPRPARRSGDRYRIGAGSRETAFTRDVGIGWEQYRLEKVYEVAGADEHLAGLLDVAAGTPLLRRHFTFYADDDPRQLSTTCIPLSIVQGTPVMDPEREPWPGGTKAQLASLGVMVTSIEEEIATRLPTDDEAGALHIPAGVPVFEITRRMLAGDRPVETACIVIPGDRAVLRYRNDV